MKNKFIKYVNCFQEGNEAGLFFLENNYKEGELTQNEVEHILDYLYSTKKQFVNIGNKTILEKANKWSEKLQKQECGKEDEIEGVDYEIEYDFGDGFKFVKLLSENSYKREGKLMSHCVASYYGRDLNIYSLRDEKNNPHATIEENNQVKGKGNQTVDNKYFGYCIEFLENKGFSIGENEMKNIGYYKLSSIDEGLSCEKLYKDKYISDKDLDKIKDKEGKRYYGFGLFNIDINKINVEKLVNYNFSKNLATSGDYSKLATSGNGSKLATSGNGSKLATSGNGSHLTTSGYGSKLATSGDYSKLATSGDFSKLDIKGKNSIGVCLGRKSIIKGIKGTHIILVEYNDEGEIIFVKTGIIDGEKLKENVYYTLKNGQFKEIN